MRCFRTGQCSKAIENARKVLVNKDRLPAARAAVAVVPAMIGVLRGRAPARECSTGRGTLAAAS